MKIIAITLAVLVSACTLPAQYGYGPNAAPPPAPYAQAQRPASNAPGAENGMVTPGLDDVEASDATELDADGIPIGAASASAWVTSPIGDRLCFLGDDPHLGQGAKMVVRNKTERLHVAYVVNSGDNVVVLKSAGDDLWRRNDNGYGMTVLPPQSFCVFDAKHNKAVTFMAYGYVNIGSVFAPEFRPVPEMEMKKPETIAVHFEREYTEFPLSSYRFKQL